MAGVLAGPFPHLHVSSAYSMRYGTAFPQALAERAFEHGMDILALTDRDGLYGAVKHARACADAGIAPVFGVDLALADPEPEPWPLTGPGAGLTDGRGA
ncbi:PHP domain-containing protein, partial [Nonomuraea sp. MCN248]